MYYVGLDIHTTRISICILNETGQLAERRSDAPASGDRLRLAARRPPRARPRFLPTQGCVSSAASLDICRTPAYTFNMSNERPKPAATPCLCNALRRRPGR